MKHLLLTLVLCSAIFLPSAHALSDLPYFDSLRAEVLNQLNIATNTSEPDKKLVSALRKALTTIDKTKPDFASGAKALGTLAKGLNRTTVSNEFAGEFYSTIGDYVAGLLINASALSNRLASTFPSKARTAAEGNLADLDESLDSALAAGDVAAAAKFLSTAAKNFSTAAKNVDKAEDAPAPSAQYAATITGSFLGTFNFTPTQAPTSATLNIGNNALLITGVYQQLSGSGASTRSKICTLTINIPSIVNGTTTYEVGTGSSGKALVTAIMSDTQGPTFDTYIGASGTLTVTANTTAHTATGSFTFVAPGAATATTASTSNGSFSVVWIQ